MPDLALPRVLTCLLALLAGCATAPSTPVQDLARRELDAIHAALRDAHPGAIDDENPAYRQRIESGYAAALARLPEVRDERDAMALSDWYVARFHDGHLYHASEALHGDWTIASGWIAAHDAVDDRLRVTAVLPNWAVPLPPVGAELLGCDGRAPDRLVEEDVLAYVGPQSAAWRHDAWDTQLSRPAMSSLRYTACTFRLPDGQVRVLAQRYRSVGEAGMTALWASLPPTPAVQHVNDFELLADGTLWVRAGDFQPDTAAMASLDEMLGRLEQLAPARRIVFDTRGNGGGDSRIGDRLLDAATGGLEFDRDGLDALPRTQGWWRISAQSVAAMDWRIEGMRSRLGPDAEIVREQSAFQERMRQALACGERWMAQDEGEPQLPPAELERRHAHFRRFRGPVALLTDGNCYSACLDFADRVRQVPGALHLGETTGFDSVYLDIGALTMPSGNRLVLPLKVWRNRLRGNDEPWVPQVAIRVAGVDEATVRAAVLAAFDRVGR